MICKLKTFDQLTTRELYELLRLRSAVFIVEQEGCYQDLDGIDYRSLHLFYQDEQGQILGCLRLFPKEDEPHTIQLGRIVCRDRRTGLGTRMLREAEQIAKERYHAAELYITGRKSALGFYQKCGYRIADDGALPYHILRRSISGQCAGSAAPTAEASASAPGRRQSPQENHRRR